MSTRPTTIAAARRGKVLRNRPFRAVVRAMACSELHTLLAPTIPSAGRRLPRAWLVVGAVVVAMASCAPPPTTADAAPRQLAPSDHPLNGEVAPNFHLIQWSPAAEAPAETISLDKLRGKLVLLDFWATWCKPCKASFPSYQQLQDAYGERIAVVAVSEDDETDEFAGFLRDTSASFAVAWDEDQSVARRYRIRGMPTLFLIGPEGVIRNVHAGFRPGDEVPLRRSVEAILAGD